MILGIAVLQRRRREANGKDKKEEHKMKRGEDMLEISQVKPS